MDTPSVAAVAALLGNATPDELPSLIERFCCDGRAGVVSAVARARRRLERTLSEKERLDALADVERDS